MKKSLALRVIIDVGGRIAILLLTILMARSLGVEEFGKLAFAISYANLLYFFTEAGIHLVYLREMGQAVEVAGKVAQVWREFFGLKLVLSLAVGFAGAALSFWVWPWGNPVPLVAITGWMVGNTIIDFFHQTCNARNMIVTSALMMALHRGLCVVFVLLALILDKSLLAVCLGFFLGSFVGTLLGYRVLRRHLSLLSNPYWDHQVWTHWLRVSLPVGMANFFGSTYTRLGILMLPWLGLGNETGFYGAAHKLFEGGYMIPAALMSVAVPHLSRTLSGSPSKIRDEIFRVGEYVTGAGILWLASGLILAPLVVGILFGATFSPAVPLLRILILANGLVFINYFLTHLLVVFHGQVRHAMNEALCLGCSALSTYFLTSTRGAAGAAWALVTTEMLLLFLTCASLVSVRRAWIKKTMRLAN